MSRPPIAIADEPAVERGAAAQRRSTYSALDRQVAADVLRCPACHEDLGGGPGAPALGSVVCTWCGYRIPFARQVLVNLDGDRGRLLEAVRAGHEGRAMRVVLQRHAARTAMMSTVGLKLTFRRYVRHSLVADVVSPIAGLLAMVGRGRGSLGSMPLTRKIAARLLGVSLFNLYARNRFTTPSFLAIVPLLGVVADAPGLVLDAPCGYGHLAYAISRLVPERRVAAMDLRSSFAYATRRFFVPGAAATISHDMNRPLPLSDGRFSAIFCSDAFHYIRDKRGLAREFMRLLRDDGVAVLAHLHNRLHYNFGSGYALAPDEYQRVFDGFHVRMFTEQQMVDAYLSDRPVDLSAGASRRALDRSPAIVLVAARSSTAFRAIPNARRRLAARASKLVVNPLYDVELDGGLVVFRRNVPPALMVDFPAYTQVLPERVTLPDAAALAASDDARASSLERLVSDHVLIDVPAEY